MSRFELDISSDMVVYYVVMFLASNAEGMHHAIDLTGFGVTFRRDNLLC